MSNFINSENIEQDVKNLLIEYENRIPEVENLCEIIDPESTPYKSKYAAREILDGLRKKFETYNILMKVENSANMTLLRALKDRINSIAIKLASIAYECEEPHETEKELSFVCSNFYPEFIEEVNILCSDADQNDSGSNAEAIKEYQVEEWKPPKIKLNENIDLLDAIKCLNLFGILWSGRSQVKKSFLYLLAAKNLYHSNSTVISDLTPSRKESLEAVYTHNLFYLAQAYGHIKELKLSCIYCQETLRRQLVKGFSSLASVFEWCKNCMNISDFYLAMGFYQRCYLSLTASNMILQKYIMVFYKSSDVYENMMADLLPNLTINAKINPQANDLKQLEFDVFDLEADVHRRMAKLDENLLKLCFERENVIDNIRAEYNESKSVDIDQEIANALNSFYNNEILEDQFDKEYVKIDSIEWLNGNKPVIVEQEEMTILKDTSDVLGQSFLPGINMSPLPSNLRASQILTFDIARVVFLRALTNIEAAKKYYILDGYVTDHVGLLQCQSKLYHYLTAFETDVKRILAMESRRLELLVPILQSTNKSAFESLHKQLSYELGETYLTLLDSKLLKFRQRTAKQFHTNDSLEYNIDISKLKKVEIVKCNSYCMGALLMFAYFTRIYSTIHTESPSLISSKLNSNDKQESASNVHNFESICSLSLKELMASSCESPNKSIIAIEEVRPYLNSHFLICRILTKLMIVPGITDNIDPVYPVELCLKKYNWLSEYCNKLITEENLEIVKELFGEEMKICEDMKMLLPSKIYRMKTRGEKGLNI